ncbi:AIPR family protein [Maricaulis sp. D1M11]|uniref:AIPR family protein n=1 Tax=Maricaulis sp. D1M11 TaxID=3076117 RepID=UPI0039B62677
MHDLKKTFIDDSVQEFAAQNTLTFDDAFMHWFYGLRFDLDEGELAPDDEVVDGAGERQLDIIRIDIDDAEQRAHIHLIQCKSSPNFSSNIVSLMKTGLDLVFKSPRSTYEMIGNVALKLKISEAREVMRKYGGSNISVTVYYVTLGDDLNIAPEAIQNRKIIEDEYGAGFFDSFEFLFLGVHEINRISNLRRSANRRISYNLPIIYDANRASIVEFETAGVASVLCTVSGKELAKLAQEEPRDAVFDANVRGNLGLGGRVNKNIYASATSDQTASRFWFMNNGITMVCDRFSISRDPDNPGVNLENLQIINGCQTTSSLRHAYEQGDLSERVQVQLKVYASNDRAFVDGVVVATNNQNAIGTRDLHANDEAQALIQRRIQEDFGLFYERKRGEAKSQGIARSDVVDLEKAGQAFIAIFRRQPTVSRAQKYKVFTDEFYGSVFENRNAPAQLVIAHEIYRLCESLGKLQMRWLDREHEDRSLFSYGVFHLARMVHWLIKNDEGLRDLSDVELVTLLRRSDASVAGNHEKAVAILRTVISENRETFQNLNNYFKSTASQQHVNRHLQALESQTELEEA